MCRLQMLQDSHQENRILTYQYILETISDPKTVSYGTPQFACDAALVVLLITNHIELPCK